MASVVVNGDTSGAVTLSAPAVAGTVTVTLPSTSGTMASLASVTANGVAYVNSSSQPTSGSALVFDGSNLGLGVTPSAWQTSAGSRAIQFTGSAVYGYRDTNLILIQNAYFDGAYKYYASSIAAGYYTIGSGTHTWYNAPSGTAGNAITFTQAMTLDASGNLLVGDTSAYSGSRLSVKTGNNNGTTHAWYAKNSSATLLGYQRDDGLFNTGAATNSPYNFTTATSANLFVDASGTFYRSTSSLKYKTNVQNATHGLADILKLRSVTYKGKNDGDKVYGGLIAEEIHEAGLTEFVQYAEDGTPDALNYGNMVSLCIKAIQEQQALITQLTARITALEGAA